MNNMPQTRSIIEIKRDPKDGGQGEHGPIEEVSIIARKDGDGFIICAGEHNCVRIRSCELSHLARAIRLLNVHNVLYVLSAVKCVELYREVVELLGGEGYV
jgi:hypothetical protein